MSDLAFTPALEQARLIRRGEVSSRELVDLYLDRIETYDGDLNAYVSVLDDEARALAATKDEQTSGSDPEALPPFHGVPVSIKELAFLEGAQATLATKAMADFKAPFDDETVARLKRAGMVPLGKTNAPELGTLPWSESELFGPARNPWNLAHTPGGSSGGAASALAAALCPVAQGSDGAGSIRIPASCSGVYGLKPSRHRISNAPLHYSDVGLILTTKGVLSRTVGDTAALLDVMSGYVPGDPARVGAPERPFSDEVGAAPGTLRIGILTEPDGMDWHPSVRQAMVDARRTLEDLGHETVEVTEERDDDTVSAFRTIWKAMVASQPLPMEGLEPFNRWLAEEGHRISAAELLQAEWQLRLRTRDMVARFHGEFEVLLAPVLDRPPVKVGEFRDRDPAETFDVLADYVVITPLINVSGQPAASLPLAHDEDTGLPIGLQVVGQVGAEATLLRLSAQVEEATAWVERRPPGY